MRLTNSSGYNIKDKHYFSKFTNKSIGGAKKDSSISWSPDGKMIACADINLKVFSYNIHTGLSPLYESIRKDPKINKIVFFDNNSIIGCNKDSLRIWDIRQIAKPQKTENKNDLLTFAWNNNTDLPHFATLSKDNTICVYDIRKMSGLTEPLFTDKNKNDIVDMAYDQSGSVLFCVGSDNSSSSSSSSSLMGYTKELKPLPDLLNPHTHKINGIVVSPTNKHMATCSEDSLTMLYSLPEIICERSYSHTDCSIKSLSFSHDGKYLASGC